MRKIVALIIVLSGAILAGGCAASQRSTELALRSGHPEHAVASPMTKILIDTGGAPLGAYTIEIAFDKNLYRVYDIRRGESHFFLGQPTFREDAFAAGDLRISSFAGGGYSSTGASSAKEPYHVVTIYWERVSKARGSFIPTARIVDLYDVKGARISGKLILLPPVIESLDAQ